VTSSQAPDETQVDACRRVLAALIARPELCDASAALAAVREQAARLTKVCRQTARQEEASRDRELLDRTAIRAGGGPVGALLVTPRPCYVCGRPFREVHAFYDSLCPQCADVNWRKRCQTIDLSGRVALVSGGRVKIGYAVALRLLRAGAAVHVTTRFPRDAAERYGREDDFASWSDRLTIHGLDLRALTEVERFADDLCARLPRLDVVVNNAAQTIRRPAAYYREMVRHEREAFSGSEAALIAVPMPAAAELTQLPLLPEDRAADVAAFPEGQRDEFGRPLDLRSRTSWTKELPEVELVELVEVHAINCLAPFVLLRRLDPLLMQNTTKPRFVVNVSSMEGNFAGGKTGLHPHTNMAKAAMNMITRTCAEGYAARGIFINSVDPGWVSNEAPLERAEQMARDGFREPLDLADAAARVLDPVFVGVETGEPAYGRLFKDYRVVAW
jgi:NAD(P)-dependent dehydrogenase (short-subunit alcohol dehydrogenase family)/predicted Zn-ribbon and HTH transcriptional regulator